MDGWVNESFDVFPIENFWLSEPPIATLGKEKKSRFYQLGRFTLNSFKYTLEN